MLPCYPLQKKSILPDKAFQNFLKSRKDRCLSSLSPTFDAAVPIVFLTNFFMAQPGYPRHKKVGKKWRLVRVSMLKFDDACLKNSTSPPSPRLNFEFGAFAMFGENQQKQTRFRWGGGDAKRHTRCQCGLRGNLFQKSHDESYHVI